MRFFDWMKLLCHHRFSIHPTRWVLAFLVTLVTIFNSLLYWIQQLFFGRRIEKTEIKEPPVFIIGHWRSGTTYLHELFVLDDHFTTCDTFQCFAPNHFLVSSWLLKPIVGLLLPSKRPMDNMKTGASKPQEDEFALLAMGAPTPYLTMAFPNHPPVDQAFLDMKDIQPAQLNSWKSKLLRFMKMLTMISPKPIVLKSPPHTGRVGVLLEMFPNARFIHIVRNPYVIFPSTIRTWRQLHTAQALQSPHFKDVQEYVFTCFERMYSDFTNQVEKIPSSQFTEIRYEDLVANPIQEMQRLYKELGYDNFSQAKPKLEQYLADQKDYKTNRYEIEEDLKKQIDSRWNEYLHRYGYQDTPSDS